MDKYKQTIVPEVSTKDWKGLTPLATRKKVFDYYKTRYLKGDNVINQHLNIRVGFERSGAEKTSFGGHIYPKKACLVEVLDKLIRYAEFSNWGERKAKDMPSVVGYLNFKVKVKIDDILEHVFLAIRLTNNGKFHYSMEVNIWKKGSR